jgi:hypothetical protein
VCIDYGIKRREEKNDSVYIQRIFGYILGYVGAAIAASLLSPLDIGYSTSSIKIMIQMITDLLCKEPPIHIITLV